MSVDVQPVESRRDLQAFIELPFRLHATSGVWVPPLRLERRLFLTARFNAFFSHGDAQLFLARRDGRVVGRISAQSTTPSTPSTATAGAGSASSSSRTTRTSCRRCWRPPRPGCASAGCDHTIGPADFTMNDESGVVIEGHDRAR